MKTGNAMTLTLEQARPLFPDAWDGQLDSTTQAAFDAALQSNEDIKEEYSLFCACLRDASLLGLSDEGFSDEELGHAHGQEATSVQLLGSIQEKLRTRSGGRYYRDRFSKTTIRNQPLWIALVMLVVLVLALVGLHLTKELTDAHHPSSKVEVEVEVEHP